MDGPTATSGLPRRRRALRLAHRLEVARHALQRPFEPEYRLLPALVDRRSTAIDVGGHAGWYAGRLAQLAGHVRVFEPNPELAATLAARLPRHCRVEPAALSDREAEAAVLVVPLGRDGTPGTNLAHLAEAQVLAPAVRTVTLPTIERRLDGYLEALRRVTLVKIDVEGHERAVIRGGSTLIARDRPGLIVEIEHRHDPDCADTFTLLSELGYVAFHVAGGAVEPANAAVALGQTSDGYGIRMRGGPAEAYPNNFVFVHRDDAPRRLPRLRAILRAGGARGRVGR